VLAQILAIYLIRYGSYAVYPRTKSLEQVQAEWDNQLSGDTADNNIVRIGAGENPLYALSCVARRLGDQTMFNASVINLKSGAQDVGTSVNYKTINDGMEVMQTLASKLSTGNATETEWRVDTAERFMSVVEIINERKEGNYTIILTGNFTLPSNVRFSENTSKTVTITGDSQRRTITNNIISSDDSWRGFFYIGKRITLVLGNNVTLDGNNNERSLGRVNGGNLILLEGAIIRNAKGCGVYVDGGGTFTMNGGTISDNTTKYDGCGVNIASGTFTMNGGTISNNTANRNGGGVYLSIIANFYMTGGTISGNTAKENGGGVYNSSGAFVKTGGTIDATNSAKDGKVVYVNLGGKRNRIAGPNDNLDSSKKGRAGGWE
jgi:hypothetical protein